MEKSLTSNEHTDSEWDTILGPKRSNLSLNFKEVWRYRDLLVLFIKKDIVTVYKQTILGPIWFLIQPIFTTIIYVAIFGKIGKMNDPLVPPVLFFMGSVTLWNYFSDTLNDASVFGKVYFPRIILPLSKVISGVIKFLIQFVLFIIFWLYYIFISKSTTHIAPNAYVLLFPVLLLVVSALSLGFGLFITAMTTKYRDLTFLISFGVQLAMYATPVIYPVSKHPQYKFILFLNPLTSIFEAFKYGFLGSGILDFGWLLYSIVFTCVVLILGILIFNKVEKRFIDTV